MMNVLWYLISSLLYIFCLNLDLDADYEAESQKRMRRVILPMPAASKDNLWYSIEQGSVHLLVMSTEHPWSEKSEQYNWMEKDLSSVDRTKSPRVIFIGHRPMFSSNLGIPTSVNPNFVDSVEPLLLKNKVDLVFFAHVHNYERTCVVYQGDSRGMPRKNVNGIDTYDNNNYTAPVHAIVGAAGFKLDSFSIIRQSWSISRIFRIWLCQGACHKDRLLDSVILTVNRFGGGRARGELSMASTMAGMRPMNAV